MIRYIYATPSMEGSEGVLAIVIKNVPLSYNMIGYTKFVTDERSPLQIGCLKYDRTNTVSPHIHLPRKRMIEQTQEVLIVRDGKINVSIFDTMGNLVETVILEQGDIIALMSGGHSLYCVESADVIEIKNGPYNGRQLDKMEFPPSYLANV